MDNKTLLFTLIAIVVVTIIASFFILSQEETELSPENLNLEECKVLQNKGEGKINLVFFSDETNAKKYSEYLLTIKPFNEYENAFNFFYIDNYEAECELYQDKALLCYDKDMIKKSSSCPNDYIVVIKEQSNKIRSSAYMNVMSLNSKHRLSVFAHEFGHAFVTLAEEYTPAQIPAGSKNCVSNCEKFSGETDGCFEGCSKSNFFRSIQSGIMLTLRSSSYGIFNENIILEKIKSETKSNSGITGQAIGDINSKCENQKYVLIKGDYNQGKIQLTEQSIETGCAGKNGDGSLKYFLTLDDNSILNQGEFNAQFIFTDAEGEEMIDGEVIENTGEFYLKIPYNKKSEKLEIIKEGNTIAEINLQNIGSKPCKI